MTRSILPTFAQLPVNKADPPHSAWGVWGKDSDRGTINHLTDDVVLAASKEIQTGVRVSLDWPLDQPKYPYLNRKPLKHEIIHKAPRFINDDILHFNTQIGSQWDSLRHFGNQETGQYYGGTLQEDITGETPNTKNGIQIWAEIGIAGRGVLIDYWTWSKKNGIDYDAWNQHAITVEEIEKCAADHGIKFRRGDILFIRTGHHARYLESTDAEREIKSQGPPFMFAGLSQGVETLEWVWDTGFAAIAADNPGLECMPPVKQPMLHPNLLAGFGLPIGELFDLETLAATCQRLQRWTFFLSSAPLHMPGGVASPPNALAFF